MTLIFDVLSWTLTHPLL